MIGRGRTVQSHFTCPLDFTLPAIRQERQAGRRTRRDAFGLGISDCPPLRVNSVRITERVTSIRNPKSAIHNQKRPQALPNYSKRHATPPLAGPYHRQKRQRLATFRPVQTRRKSRVKPTVENYLASHSSALLRAADTMVVACDAPACFGSGNKSARQPTGPDFIEPRIGSTGVDAHRGNPPLSSPPGFRLPALIKCPLRRTCLPTTA
jgi:hypothetical protein